MADLVADPDTEGYAQAMDEAIRSVNAAEQKVAELEAKLAELPARQAGTKNAMVVTEEFRVAVVRLGKEEGRPFADYHCMHPGSYGQDSEDSLCYACCSNVQLFDWGPDGQKRGLSVPTGNPSPSLVLPR